MIIDNNLEFADAASVVAAAGTTLIGDVIDLGAVQRDVGAGQPLWLVITCATSIITAGTAGTIQFALVSDAQEAIAVDGSATVHLQSAAFVTDDDALNRWDAGSVIFAAPLPIEGATYERYLGVLSTVGITATSAGAINAFLTLDPPYTGKTYNDGVN